MLRGGAFGLDLIIHDSTAGVVVAIRVGCLEVAELASEQQAIDLIVKFR